MSLGPPIIISGTVGVALLLSSRSSRGEHADRAVASSRRTRRHDRARMWMASAGLSEVRPVELVAASVLLGLVGAVVGFAIFGGALPAVGAGLFTGAGPAATYRQRRKRRMAIAEDAWPQLIDEIRILCTSSGRSIPQALFEAGLHGPPELRDAFLAARREWALSTDFARTIDVLTAQLGSPVADATCETLLVAHEVGGSGLDRRLVELAEDRRIDGIARKDARSRQAGVRFARRFVVLVPLGMALAGLSMGNGRDAYRGTVGQALAAAGVGLVALCWVWSAHMLRLPEEEGLLR